MEWVNSDLPLKEKMMFLSGMISKRVQKILKDISSSTLVIISLIVIEALIRILKTLVIPYDDYTLGCILVIDHCCLIVLMMRLFLVCCIESVGDIFRVLKKEIQNFSKIS